MKTEIPQLIYLALTLIGLLIAAHQHGKPKTGKHNFWALLIASCVPWALLYFGGFFTV